MLLFWDQASNRSFALQGAERVLVVGTLRGRGSRSVSGPPLRKASVWKWDMLMLVSSDDNNHLTIFQVDRLTHAHTGTNTGIHTHTHTHARTQTHTDKRSNTITVILTEIQGGFQVLDLVCIIFVSLVLKTNYFGMRQKEQGCNYFAVCNY